MHVNNFFHPWKLTNLYWGHNSPMNVYKQHWDGFIHTKSNLMLVAVFDTKRFQVRINTESDETKLNQIQIQIRCINWTHYIYKKRILKVLKAPCFFYVLLFIRFLSFLNKFWLCISRVTLEVITSPSEKFEFKNLDIKNKKYNFYQRNNKRQKLINS